MLASSKFSGDDTIDFDAIYKQLGDKRLSIEKRELILNEDPASKTAKHVVDEVRSIFKRCLNVDKDLHEVLDQPLSDDFLNLIEIACSIKP
jgi:hypothetical protein